MIIRQAKKLEDLAVQYLDSCLVTYKLYMVNIASSQPAAASDALRARAR